MLSTSIFFIVVSCIRVQAPSCKVQLVIIRKSIPLSYGLASWGAACETRLQTVRTKQNKCIPSVFFASQRENASIYYKLQALTA